MSDLLDEAEEIDLQCSMMSVMSRKLKHEYLESKGWEISGEMIGPSMNYFYKKGDYFGMCEYEALDHEEHECIDADNVVSIRTKKP